MAMLDNPRKIFVLVNSIRNRIKLWLRIRKHKQKLWKKVHPGSESYGDYLDLQLVRSLSKKDAPLPDRSRYLIDQVASRVDLGNKKVLCVGCRNTAELDYFKSKNVPSIVGIDLFSDNQDILVMDMHHMEFPSDSFDLVYSSHSLEHSQDPAGAAHEFIRVARPGAKIVIEVPVNFVERGADLVDFKRISNLIALFEPHVQEIDWSEETDRSHSDAGTDVIRTIFTVKKTGSGAPAR